jgi:hypothetical protein
MKKLALPLLLLITGISFAQIVLNTTDPSKTLDVNGTMRIRNLTKSIGAPATKIVSVDDDGNLTEMMSGRNIQLIDNVMSGDNTYTIDRSGGVLTAGTIHDLVVLPSGPVTGFNMIRVRTTLPTTFITGIAAAPDGTTIVIYPTDGIVTLLPLDIGSSSENQMLLNANVVIAQYETAQLVYDADMQKWIKM